MLEKKTGKRTRVDGGDDAYHCRRERSTASNRQPLRRRTVRTNDTLARRPSDVRPSCHALRENRDGPIRRYGPGDYQGEVWSQAP